jgi:hypothetical protein
MMESLPDDRQDLIVGLLREYTADLKDEAAWDRKFARTRERLEAQARQARIELQAGQARSMDFDQ